MNFAENHKVKIYEYIFRLQMSQEILTSLQKNKHCIV